jgi:hypothetical protein
MKERTEGKQEDMNKGIKCGNRKGRESGASN